MTGMDGSVIVPPSIPCPGPRWGAARFGCGAPISVIADECGICGTTFGGRELWDIYEEGLLRAGNHGPRQ